MVASGRRSCGHSGADGKRGASWQASQAGNANQSGIAQCVVKWMPSSRCKANVMSAGNSVSANSEAAGATSP